MISAALIAWPILTVILAFRAPWHVTVTVAIFGGYLLLPERGGFDLPLLPRIFKDTIPGLTLLFFALLFRPGHPGGPLPQAIPQHMVRPGWIPTSLLGVSLLGVWIIGALMTALTNGDVLNYGPRTISGLRLYDGFNIIVSSTALLVPLILGRKYFSHPDMHRVLVVALVGWAAFYSLLTLYEVRMSPQLNNMIYGFFPHDWHQHTRGDGFRPIVFLRHGLKLSLFICLGMLAAFGLVWLLKGAMRAVAFFVGIWLLGTLVLTKSLGALLIGLMMLPVVLLLPSRLKLLAAAVVAGFVLTYPMLRNFDVAPTNHVLAIAGRIDPARASSFEFRLRNEDALLAKAAERPLFGWGGWGRNRVIDEDGRDTSVTDGSWVIAFGTGGWAEYLAKFGLLTLPIIILAARGARHENSDATAVLCVVLAANALDLIPNSGQSPIMWLMAGALLGRLELGRATEPVATMAADAKSRPPGYTRQPGPSSGETSGGPVYTRQTHRHERRPTSAEA